MEENQVKLQILMENIFENYDLERELLQTTPYELVIVDPTEAALLASLSAQTVAIINVRVPITAETVARFPSSVKIITKLGTGFDRIDVNACRSRNIEVCNTPDYGTNTIADHTVALLFAAQRRLLPLHRTIIETRRWGPYTASELRSLDTATLGVIGAGRIGRCFVEKMRPFVKNILLYPSKRTPPEVLQELLEQSDIISLHIPHDRENHHFISTATIAQMKRRPVLINVSRGGLIDTQALIEALKTGHISYAALDVVEGEPAVNEELIQLDNVLLSPHAAWSSVASKQALRVQGIRETLQVLSGAKPSNPICA